MGEKGPEFTQSSSTDKAAALRHGLSTNVIAAKKLSAHFCALCYKREGTQKTPIILNSTLLSSILSMHRFRI